MKFNDKQTILELTSSWTGERFDDGRPRVSDALLKRLSKLTTEEAYIAMVEKGYKLQYESDFRRLNNETRLIGRAVTAVMVPSRPDVHQHLLDHGRKNEGRTGFFNQWVIETLVENDVLVVDMCDQILYGTYIGGNLSTAIKRRTKNGGAVIWGGIRDLEQMVDIPDFQVYYRGVHPSPIGDVMMTGMNVPARIGHAVCLPGDVVLGTVSGVIFIPPHLAESVASRAEKSLDSSASKAAYIPPIKSIRSGGAKLLWRISSTGSIIRNRHLNTAILTGPRKSKTAKSLSAKSSLTASSTMLITDSSNILHE